MQINRSLIARHSSIEAFQISATSENCIALHLPDCNAWAQIQQSVVNPAPGAAYTLTLYAKGDSILTPANPFGGCQLGAFIGATTDPADSSFVAVNFFFESTPTYQQFSLPWTILDANTVLTLRWECAADAFRCRLVGPDLAYSQYLEWGFGRHLLPPEGIVRTASFSVIVSDAQTMTAYL
jgi:hypothetical protein